MSGYERDAELERRLDAMFGSARPRPGFADELWGRVSGRRWWAAPGVWLRPVVLAPVAAALVVLLGISALLLQRPLTSSPTSGALRSEESATPGFGKLPPPLATKVTLAAPVAVQPATGAGSMTQNADAYAAPAGQVGNAAPVYRWKLASPTAAPPPIAGGHVRYAPPIPRYSASVTFVGTADQLVERNGLNRLGPYEYRRVAGDTDIAVYAWIVNGTVLVLPDGQLGGVRATVINGVGTVEGELPVETQAADYALRPPPAGAHLVYVIASRGEYSYFEPAWLANGSVTPAIAASYLSS